MAETKSVVWDKVLTTNGKKNTSQNTNSLLTIKGKPIESIPYTAYLLKFREGVVFFINPIHQLNDIVDFIEELPPRRNMSVQPVECSEFSSSIE